MFDFELIFLRLIEKHKNVLTWPLVMAQSAKVTANIKKLFIFI